MLFSAVEIEINHHCNRRCSYCPNSTLKRKSRGEIDPTLYLKLMSELRELGFAGRISYDFYNEPLLHSDFEKIVSETRSHLPDSSIEVYTNGTILDRNRFTKLTEAGVSRFFVTKHEYERDYVFEETFANLSSSERDQVVYRDYTKLVLTNRGGLLKKLGCAPAGELPCFIPSSIVTVTVSGNVLPCFEDYEEHLVMGNIRERSLFEIWNSDHYVRFRNQLKAGFRNLHVPCRGCSRRAVLPPIR